MSELFLVRRIEKKKRQVDEIEDISMLPLTIYEFYWV